MCDSAEKSCALGISAFLTRPNGNIVLFVDLGGDHEARCHRGNCRHLHNRIYTNRISGGYAGEGTYRRTGSGRSLGRVSMLAATWATVGVKQTPIKIPTLQ
jgi:hypothetical protein